MPTHHEHGNLRGRCVNVGERVFYRVHGISQGALQAVFFREAKSARLFHHCCEDGAIPLHIGAHGLQHGHHIGVIAEQGRECIERGADGRKCRAMRLDRRFIVTKEEVLLVAAGLQQTFLHIIVQVIPIAGLHLGRDAAINTLSLP